MRDQRNRKTVMLIANFHTSGSASVFLEKYIRIMVSIGVNLIVVTNGFYYRSSQYVTIVPYSRTITRLLQKERVALIRALRLLLIQFEIVYKMIKLSSQYQSIILFPQVVVIPAMFSKILKKSLMTFAAGQNWGKNNKATLSELAMWYQSQLVYMLSERILVESRSLVNCFGLRGQERRILDAATYVNSDIFHVTLPVEERENIIGYIGGFEIDKGVRNFVESIPFVLEKAPDVQFVLIGRGEMDNLIDETIHTRLIENNTKKLGWIQHNEIPEHLNRLKLLVLPSKSEGLPNIIIEAMFCGTPVLATDVGGISEIIMNHKTGFILNNTSARGIAESIVSIIGNSLLGEISEAAYKFVQENYSFRAAAKRYQLIFSNSKI